ncbi:hypothetical protein [Desulfotruncus alcoholivorax]|nr:hypothetical protein [Desulfotruncus alcoholivorax]
MRGYAARIKMWRTICERNIGFKQPNLEISRIEKDSSFLCLG